MPKIHPYFIKESYMIICGQSSLAQFCEDYKGSNIDGVPFTKYPSNVNLDLSKIKSISTWFDFSVIVNNNGQAFGIGNNKRGQIHSSLPKEIFTELTEIKILNPNNEPYKVISAVCYDNYTLYLLSGEGEKNKLFCTIPEYDSKFIDIGDSNPKALYNSSVINEDGSITIIINWYIGEIKTRHCFLPNEKAIKCAISHYMYIALGSKGNVYYLDFYYCRQETNIEFTKSNIPENIVDINGSGYHCFAVAKSGNVYGAGYYKNCQLGIDNKHVERSGCIITGIIKFFMPIKSLGGIKVVAAFTGGVHSIFISDNNCAYWVGTNKDQIMMDNSNIKESYKPVKIDMKNVTFCIADRRSTILFIGNCSPKFCPNQKITDIYNDDYHPSYANIFKLPPLKQRLIDAKKAEVIEIKKIVQEYNQKIDQLLMEIKELEKK